MKKQYQKVARHDFRMPRNANINKHSWHYEWMATVLSIIGAFMNAFLIKEGFYIWGVANFIWIYFGIKNKHYGLALTFSVFLIINVIGIIYW